MKPWIVGLFVLSTCTGYCSANSSCATPTNLKTQTGVKFKKAYSPVDPYLVRVNHPPSSDYIDIGKVYVNRYNHCGIKRQLGVITNLMQEEAAKQGGNDVYPIQLGSHYAKGEIIRLVNTTRVKGGK